MKPLISIITPVYNGEAYIARYLDSILNQTYSKIQLIIVNDGSSDKTEEIVSSYKEKLERKGILLAYTAQENKGLGGAINTGLKLIEGEFFTWCDSDNFYDSKYLEICVRYLAEHPDCNILRCDAYMVSDDNLSSPIRRLSKGNSEKFKPDLFDNMIFEKNFHFGCALLKTCAFREVNPKNEIYPSRHGQNWQLLLPMFYKYKAHYINEPLFYYVFRKDSVSNISMQQGVEEELKKMDEYEKILIESIKNIDMDLEEYRRKIAVKYLKKKLDLVFRSGDMERLEKYYIELKENKGLSPADIIKYQTGKHKKIFDFIKLTYRKIKAVIRKINGKAE